MADQVKKILTALNDELRYTLPDGYNGAMAVQLFGSTDTCVCEASLDGGTHWTIIQGRNLNSDSMTASLVATVAGAIYQFETSGLTLLRIRKTVGTSATSVYIVSRQG